MPVIFSYGAAIIAIIVVWLMPKRLTNQEIYITWGWMAALTLFTDVSFGIVMDLYDFFGAQIDFVDLPLQALLPPSIALIIANFMPKKTTHFLLYILPVVAFSIFFEWLALKAGYLLYKGWKLGYSVPAYVIGLFYLRWHLFYLRKKTPSQG